ncbi:MAG: DNA gyrase inhibitor YacG [Gammaproteobacteria bacterium]
MKCLHCKKEFKSSDQNKFKPFCSERCRSLDLSNWLSEKNVISRTLDSEENYD